MPVSSGQKIPFIKKPGIIHIHIGKPIQTAGLKADALNSQVENWIETEMTTLSK